jgi:hypothetical protein
VLGGSVLHPGIVDINENHSVLRSFSPQLLKTAARNAGILSHSFVVSFLEICLVQRI